MAINAQAVIFVFPGKIPADLGRSSFSPNCLSQSVGAEVRTAESCPSVPFCLAHIPIRCPVWNTASLESCCQHLVSFFSNTDTF